MKICKIIPEENGGVRPGTPGNRQEMDDGSGLGSLCLHWIPESKCKHTPGARLKSFSGNAIL